MRNDPSVKLLDSRPLACFFVQSAFGTAFINLTSGVFLSGFAILLGAGDVLVSYLSVIANICGVAILLFAAFLERFRSRKRLTLALTVLSKSVTVLLVLLPALVPKELRLGVFIPMAAAAFTLQAQTTVVLNQWMFSFIDKKKSGRYISLRQTLTLIVTVVLSITGGYWMDYVNGKYLGFVILFLIAGGMGIFEIILLALTPDGETYQPSRQRCRFADIIKLPLKDSCFTGFVVYILLFYLLLNISDSFTMVFMQKYLGLPYKTITFMYMIISLPQIFLLCVWGKLSDKFGHNFVLKTSIWLFAGETLFMTFASPQTCYFFIPIAFLAASVANAGFVISVFNRRYELMPKENRIVYDNFYTAAIGLGFIMGPMIGGGIKTWIESSPLIMNTMPNANIRLLYPVSTIGILLLQILYLFLLRKKEQNEND